MNGLKTPVSHNKISSCNVLDNHLSISMATEYSDYSPQYLRRLLRLGILKGIKIGQMWLVNFCSLENHIKHNQFLKDHRFGPKKRKCMYRNMGD